MAEERISKPITAEIVTPDGVCSRSSKGGKPIASKSGTTTPPGPRRASTGSFRNRGKKLSFGKSTSPNEGATPVPNYLRASTGSCHDFCKYGKNLETEVKPWQARPRKVGSPPLSHKKGVETRDSLEKKFTKAVKSKPVPASKTNFRYPSSFSRDKVSSPSTGKKNTTTIFSSRRESELKLEKKAWTSKEALRKLVSSPVAYFATKPSFNRDLGLKDLASGSKKLVSPLKVQNKTVKSEIKNLKNNKAKEKALNVTDAKSKKTVPGLRKKQEGITENQNVPGKCLPVVKVESEKIVPESIQNKSNELISNCSEKKVHESKQKESPTDIPLCESFSSPNILSTVKSQNDLEYLNRELDGSDDAISESDEPLISDNQETSVANRSSGNSKAKGTYKEDDTATKLKFRKGKVVEIKSNNSGPRRLRFRRSRPLGENQGDDVNNQRKSFSKGGAANDLDVTNDESGKIVLRHQEVEGKKDAQGLFNNVIEETASKLVETRKSKVKALVGAFETVISLQESKPTTQTAHDEKE